MQLWRISDFDDLAGYGGTLLDGRWHRRAPIVYLAESSALALFEVFVNLAMEAVPSDYQLLQIEAADDLGIDVYPHQRPPLFDESQDWGDAWLNEEKTPLARVPSAIAPFSWNLLLNPLHPGARGVRVAATSRWPWDRRLFR